jgi:hypothetical protein
LEDARAYRGRRTDARRVDVLRVFRLPSPPADAAAARAALAGVTRLELRGFVERGQLADALLRLPGLREVSLRCQFESPQRPTHELGEDLVAALAGCPSIQSLEWRAEECWPAGALGSKGAGDGRWNGRGQEAGNFGVLGWKPCAVGAFWGKGFVVLTRAHCACSTQASGSSHQTSLAGSTAGLTLLSSVCQADSATSLSRLGASPARCRR